MTTPHHDLVLQTVPIKSLHPHPENARKGDIQRIAESLATLGQYAPIVVNVGSKTGRPNEILAGHHLVQAAETILFWDRVQVTLVDVNDENAKKIMIADNRTSDLATYDDRLLLELLDTLDDLDGTGYEPGDLDALRAFLDSADIGDIDDQDVLDESDKAVWPEVRAKIRPNLHAQFMTIPGDDDAERLTTLLENT